MTKSSWKPSFVDYQIIKQLVSAKKNSFSIKTKSRSSVILQSFVGRRFLVYTGRNYKKVHISEEMVGHKLGEFAFTRKIGYIHYKRKKKKR